MINYLMRNRIKQKIKGSNSKIIRGGQCVFRETIISIDGDNNVVKFGDRCNLSGLNIYIYGNNNSIIFGNDVIVNASIRQPTVMNALGGTSITIGDKALFSNNIEIHTTDYHKIYDEHGNIVNYPRDIVIGEHVWIGLGVKILKGVNIADGCIVGAGSVLTKKYNDKNVVLVGNPPRVVKRNVYWDY